MISMMTKEDKIFIDLHAEQVFNTFFLDSSIFAIKESQEACFKNSKGIYQRTLTQNTIANMKNELGSFTQKYIVINMNNISVIKDNVLIEFQKMIKKFTQNRNSILLYNVCGQVFDCLRKFANDNKARVRYEEKNYTHYIDFFSNNMPQIDELDLNAEYERLYDENLERKISEICEKHDSRSLSSRVKLSIYINVKKLLEDYPFFCYSIYLLAKKLGEANLMDLNNPDNNQDKSIFIHTLNSATIGTLLAQLFCVDIILVDHLGPYNKIYVDDLTKTINYKKKYIVVCDVICMV